jgi:GTA TIM-barrel-like domain/Conserved hypothetical protein 2217 (DUF2460)
MAYVNGVNLLPSTGEFTYDTIPYQGARAGLPMVGINTYFSDGPPGSTLTDFEESIAQLQVTFPMPGNLNACTTVAIVCSWFASAAAGTDQAAETAATCRIYPSTTYINGSFKEWNGFAWVSNNWQCSSLTQNSSGLIQISTNAAGDFNYGGTPSDQSIYRCIQYLKGLGLRVVFYPFILVDSPGKPWRGQITYDPTFTNPDVSRAAETAILSFLGTAVYSDFTPQPSSMTVSYSGSATDWTYRRMILHYATLCAMAGGVDLFLIGSELRGLETVRGPSWVESGGGPPATWDYPFLYNSSYGLMELSDEVRTIFDNASLTKDTTKLHNLVGYAADWSSWMGWQHTASNPSNPGLWPHLDQLWSHAHIDIVCFDNYLPLSDWTTGAGGIDVLNWAQPAPSSWPPDPSAMGGLGLSGTPTLFSKPYLKANIEGGEKFNWFYNNSNNLGRGIDPNGTDLQVSLPEGDRLAQTRNQYYANQQILGNKQIRWWWNSQHYAIYATTGGWFPQGNVTGWAANSKSIAFTEYGFPSNDKCTNQPNVFFSAGSVESGTAFWSIWQPADGGPGVFLPKPDQNLQLLALQAIYEYWFTDTPNNNETVGGVEMIQPAFCSVWNWDARPFPTFPLLTSVWGDAGNWRAGNWLNGKGPFIAQPIPDAISGVPVPFTFPVLPGLSWSVHKRPTFSTRVASHVSGREVRAPFYAITLYEFELTIEGLASNSAYPSIGTNSLQSLMGLYLQCQGQFGSFLYIDVTDNSSVGIIAPSIPGVMNGYALSRSVAYETEPVSWATGVSSVYLNGVWLPQYTLAETAVTSAHSVAQTLAAENVGTPIIFLCYVKPLGRTTCTLQISDGIINQTCAFDLAAVTAMPGTSGITTSLIKAAPNGFYLISASINMAAAAAPTCTLFIQGTSSYLGVVGDGVYLASPMAAIGNTAAAFLTFSNMTGATLSTANWTVTQPNTVTLANEYKLIEANATASQHYGSVAVESQSSGTMINFMAYILAAEDTACRLNFNNGSVTIGCDFNLATGAAGIPDSGISAASIVAAGGGWYLCSITGNMAATAAPSFFILTEATFGTPSYAGVSGHGIYYANPNWSAGAGTPAFLPALTASANAAIAAASVAGPTSPVVSADCAYAFKCRFLDDQEDFEQFMSNLWQVQSLKFRSVKP